MKKIDEASYFVFFVVAIILASSLVDNIYSFASGVSFYGHRRAFAARKENRRTVKYNDKLLSTLTRVTDRSYNDKISG